MHRMTLDLSDEDHERLLELKRHQEEPSKAATLRRLIRWRHAALARQRTRAAKLPGP